MRLFLSALNAIGILYLVCSISCVKKKIFKVRKRKFTDLKYHFFTQKLDKLSIEIQLYPKLTKIDAFEQKKCIYVTAQLSLSHSTHVI